MVGVIASEGGYQLFELDSTARMWLIIAAVIAVAAVGLGFVMMKGVLAKDTGTEKMGEIAGSIQEGAMAYIKRQFRTIGICVVPLAAIVFLTSKAIENTGATSEMSGSLSFAQSGLFRTLAFIVGAILSGFIGFLGMWRTCGPPPRRRRVR